MNPIQLITKEILHRKFNFLASLLAVIAAVTLIVFLLTMGKASQRETARLMRDLGYNLHIVSKATDLQQFWARGYSDHTMPEEYVNRFAEQRGLSYSHLLALVKQRIEWRGREVVLTGIASEVSPPDKKKPSMIFSIDKDFLHVGFQLARGLEIKKGDSVELLGKSFKVANCLAESGSEDDITLYASLEDAQELLDMKGRINEIKALECLCRDDTEDTLTLLREQLAGVLPEAVVIQKKNIAKARESQRLMMERHFALTLPMVIVACAAWIGLLAMLNVRERRRETGILRALGYGSGYMASLYLGKAALIGVIGAALGFLIGTALALGYGPEVFKVTAKFLATDYSLLIWALAGAPVFSALVSLLPALAAVTQDPADTLREE